MKKLLILLIVLSLTGCNRVTPSGFWLRYKSDLITEKLNDQGPWGGTLAVHWKTTSDSKFNKIDLVIVSEKKSWKLIDSIEISQLQIQNMVELGKPTIRLPLKNFKPNPKKDDYKSEPLPRWMHVKSKLYRFETNWHLFHPGTDDSTSETGFILLNEDRTEMTVYHIWGE